jgi:3-hydroxyisobutyrate dehydrogenase-like beta-hydroxyacid dehydrogenase/alkylhydroperoxidase/carboxymuconolactone decarboxylase family protein YurZ
MTQVSAVRQQRCGVIGMGMIGAGVAACLVRKGREVSGYDVRPAAVAAVEGVKACASPAEVASRSDVIIVSVVNAEQAETVIFGDKGISSSARPELVVALMSTIRVTIVREFAQRAAESGFKLIDVAITTGGGSVANGGSALMAGGDAETVESVRGVMEDFAVLFSHMGPIGAGMAAKVARNIMHYAATLGAYEGGLLAEAAGVDIGKLIEVIRKSDPHNIMSTLLLEKRGTKPLQGLPEAAMEQFRGWANLLYKDLDAGIDLADSLGVEVPGARLSMERGDLIYGLPPGTTPHGPKLDEDPKLRGLQMMDQVYGKGTVPMPPASMELPPYVDATVRWLFGDVWSRPGLSIRDRRMLVIGATAQMNRADLIEIQVTGALKNKELTEEQCQEMVLQLAFYCGWGNATAVHNGVTAALKKYKESKATK